MKQKHRFRRRSSIETMKYKPSGVTSLWLILKLWHINQNKLAFILGLCESSISMWCRYNNKQNFIYDKYRDYMEDTFLHSTEFLTSRLTPEIEIQILEQRIKYLKKYLDENKEIEN